MKLLTEILLIALMAVLLFVVIKQRDPVLVATHTPATRNCAVNTEERTVRGTSLQGVIESGQDVTILTGYYRCEAAKRGDIAVFDYAGNESPVIKIVRAIPGDTFRLREDSNSGWHIIINNEILYTSDEVPYSVNNRARALLQGYVDSYAGVIPPDTYLVLGNHETGSLDSTHFGLIHRSELLGKVIEIQ